jgi:DNA-binding LacI/PurR family transcriptional regulator
VLTQPLDRDREDLVVRGGEVDLEHVLFPVTRDRLAGYREAAEDAGLDWAEVVIAVCARNDDLLAERAAASLLAGDRPPDAIAAMSDQQAMGVLRAAAVLGRTVPDDLAVSGWDDVAAAAGLGLTTVAQSLREQGATCARLVLDGGSASTVAAAWAVVRRGSTRGERAD